MDPGTIVKSPLDKREYRALTLPNQLKVLLIRDSESYSAAASMTVAIGSMNDPVNLPGLAHFLEHMLSLGTEKYPRTNEYTSFLAQYGGCSNAITKNDSTTYHFDLSADQLPGALDRFAQFFISPLFLEEVMEREVNVVHNEFEENRKWLSWRSDQMERETANQSHSYSHFSAGNRDTLWDEPTSQGINMRTALLDFYKGNYSSNLMALVVQGRDPLDDLQKMVESLFCHVPNLNLVIPSWPESPFGVAELQMKLEVVPIRDIRRLVLMFPVTDISQCYKSNPEEYLTHVIGYEGVGSLLSVLKRKNWADGLDVLYSTLARGCAKFEIELNLTEDGLKKMHDIVRCVFQYLAMLRKVGPKKWLWDEIRDVEGIRFRFKGTKAPWLYVSELSEAMLAYPMTDVLSATFLLTEYKPEIITEMLEKMIPENLRVTIIAKEFSGRTEHVERYFGVEYNWIKIDPGLIKEWKTCGLNPELQLPTRNEFIPSNFELKPRDEKETTGPRELIKTANSRLWFLQQLEQPKAVVKVEIFSPLPMKDPLEFSLNMLFVLAVKDSLTEYAYSAAITELGYEMTATPYGIVISVSGYDHKLKLLLDTIFTEMINLKVNPQQFELLKNTWLRGLSNFECDDPFVMASQLLTYLLAEPLCSISELLSTAHGVTLERLQKYAVQFQTLVKFEWLVLGNFTAEEAKDLVNGCEVCFERKGGKALLRSEIFRLREINLGEGTRYLFKSETKIHPTSCAAVYFQTGLLEPRQNVLTELLANIAQDPCHHTLRTEEMLGYTVICIVRRANSTQGIQILVQGVHHPVYVESKIDLFLESFKERLDGMTDDEFLPHCDTLIAQKRGTPIVLDELANSIWNDIVEQTYNFDREEELEVLSHVTLADLREFFNSVMGAHSKKRKMISVHVVSMAEGGAGLQEEVNLQPKDNVIVIDNVAAWKSQQFLYPALIEKVAEEATVKHLIPGPA